MKIRSTTVLCVRRGNQVTMGCDGQVTVGCYLYDVALGQQLAKAGWTVAPGDWRRAAHKCADMVYSRLSGESPFFDSRIAYIAETGPKNRRMKRLAIMDSDGGNHRFITNGQALAISPRFSPDYKKIVYVSYLNNRVRVFIYDINAGTQKLVTESSNATFAPRWSPADGPRADASPRRSGTPTRARRRSSAGVAAGPRRTPASPCVTSKRFSGADRYRLRRPPSIAAPAGL